MSRLSAKRILPVIVSLAIVAAAATVLVRTVGRIDMAEVVNSFRSIDVASLIAAATFAAGALLSLAVYEVAMLRYIESGMRDRRPFLTALIAYPVGAAVGFGALSGGAVRYRFYSAAGLSAFDLGKVVVLSTMPYAAGLGFLCGVSLVTNPAEAGRMMTLSTGTALAIGAGLLAAHAAYVVAVLRVRGPLRLKRFDLELPSPRMTAIQYALGLTEVLCAVTVLWVLLPAEAQIAFLPFVAVYVLAILAGLLSSVPAGLGVFEAVLLLMLRDVPQEALLGAVLAYRLIYQVVPFVAGLCLFVGWEAWSRRHLLPGAVQPVPGKVSGTTEIDSRP